MRAATWQRAARVCGAASALVLVCGVSTAQLCETGSKTFGGAGDDFSSTLGNETPVLAP